MNTDRQADADKLKAWLDADPKQAVEAINAGLALLATHGYAQEALAHPQEWVIYPAEEAQEQGAQ